MLVREATESDVAAIVEIENEAIRSGFAHFGTEPVGLDVATERWRKEHDRYPWLVALDGGQVIGYARASAWKGRQAYWLTCEIGVYVRSDVHRRGVGTALYEVLFPMLRERGFHTVLAGVALPNEASVRLHERFGMRHVGTFPEVGFKLGQWRDVGYWQERLTID